MRNLSFKFILLVLACALFTSCSDDDNDDGYTPVTKDNLTGFWQYEEAIFLEKSTEIRDREPSFLEFTADGKVHKWSAYYRESISGLEYKYEGSGTYTLGNGKVSFSIEAESIMYQYKMKDGKLMPDKASYTVYLVKTNKPQNLPYTKSLTLSINSYKFSVANPQAVISIMDGEGEYTATSSNEKVAIAAIQGRELHIGGGEIGKAVITVTDKSGRSAFVDVSSDENIPRPTIFVELVIVKKGASKELLYNYTGDKYSVYSENEEIATSKVEGSKVVISGVKAGETGVYIKEYGLWDVSGYGVIVVDSYDLAVSTTQVAGYMGMADEIGFHIHSGNGDYKITSSDPTVASFEVEPYRLEMSGAVNNPETVIITPLKEGQTELTITDAENKTVTVNVQIRR